MTLANGEGKSKTAAVLLAVFLSFWTWLYTYKKDAWKFWVGLVATLGIGALVVFLYIPSPYDFVLSLVFNSGIWIWSIVDAVSKKDEWYRSYPGKKLSS